MGPPLGGFPHVVGALMGCVSGGLGVLDPRRAHRVAGALLHRCPRVMGALMWSWPSWGVDPRGVGALMWPWPYCGGDLRGVGALT